MLHGTPQGLVHVLIDVGVHYVNWILDVDWIGGCHLSDDGRWKEANSWCIMLLTI